MSGNPKPYTAEEIAHMRSSTRGEYERERLTAAECYNNERAWIATVDAERSRAEKAEAELDRLRAQVDGILNAFESLSGLNQSRVPEPLFGMLANGLVTRAKGSTDDA